MTFWLSAVNELVGIYTEEKVEAKTVHMEN